MSKDPNPIVVDVSDLESARKAVEDVQSQHSREKSRIAAETKQFSVSKRHALYDRLSRAYAVARELVKPERAEIVEELHKEFFGRKIPENTGNPFYPIVKMMFGSWKGHGKKEAFVEDPSAKQYAKVFRQFYEKGWDPNTLRVHFLAGAPKSRATISKLQREDTEKHRATDPEYISETEAYWDFIQNVAPLAEIEMPGRWTAPESNMHVKAMGRQDLWGDGKHVALWARYVETDGPYKLGALRVYGFLETNPASVLAAAMKYATSKKGRARTELAKLKASNTDPDGHPNGEDRYKQSMEIYAEAEAKPFVMVDWDELNKPEPEPPTAAEAMEQARAHLGTGEPAAERKKAKRSKPRQRTRSSKKGVNLAEVRARQAARSRAGDEPEIATSEEEAA